MSWKPRLPPGAIRPGPGSTWYQVCVDAQAPDGVVYVQLPRVYVSRLTWAKLLAGKRQTVSRKAV